MNDQELDTSWFNLKNYAELKDFNLDGWIAQFKLRNDGNINFVKEHPVFEGLDELHSMCKKLVAPLDTDAVKFFSVFQFSNLIKDENIFKALPSVDKEGRLIDVSVTPEDHSISVTMKEPDGIKPLGVWLGDGSIVYLSFDLRYSDEQLIKEFSDALIKYRETYNIEPYRKKLSDNDIKKWVEYKVLQYIDLMLIAESEGKTISYSKMANLLFPDEYDINREERIRKTTKPEAEKLMKLFLISPSACKSRHKKI